MTTTFDQGAVFQALARSKPVEFFRSLPDFEDSAVQNGFTERRALAIRNMDADGLRKAQPLSPEGAKMFGACLDALGEILLAEEPEGAWLGARAHIASAQKFMAKTGLMLDYDLEAYKIAAHAFRSLVPSSSPVTPHLDDWLDEETLTRASSKSLGHYLLAKRLADNKDIFEIMFNELHDLDATAWFLSRQILDKPAESEVSQFLIMTGEVSPDDLKSAMDRLQQLEAIRKHLEPEAGFASLEELYADRERFKNQEKRYLELISGGSQDPQILSEYRRNRRNLRQLRRKLRKVEAGQSPFSDKSLAALDARIQATKSEISKHDGEVARYLHTYDEKSRGESERTPSLDARIREPRLERPCAPVDLAYYLAPDRSKDRVIHAGQLITPNQAVSELNGLYRKYAAELRLTNREARRLAERLRAPYTMTIDRDLEEDELDASRFAPLIANPLYATPYMRRNKHAGATTDTAICFLDDNSGSMGEDKKIQLAFLTADRLSYWLSTLRIKTEILGFTTRNISADVKRGRTDAVEHIIFKTYDEAHTPKITQRLAAMLKGEYRRRTVLGEAILWAHERLLAVEAQRKILMVSSDGKPDFNYNYGTASPRTEDMPQRHLKDVVHNIEVASPVEIIGIGIGHEVSDYFSNAVMVTRAEDLAFAMPKALEIILDPPATSRLRSLRPLRSVTGAGFRRGRATPGA